MSPWSKCPQCGKMLPGGAMFCRRCGSRLSSSPVPPVPIAARPTRASCGPASSGRRGWLVLALVVYGAMYLRLTSHPTVHVPTPNYSPPTQTHWSPAPVVTPQMIPNPNIPMRVTTAQPGQPGQHTPDYQYRYDRDVERQNVGR